MWIFGLAAAAEPLALQIHPSPEARVVLLGSTRANHAEIGIYGNHAPIGVDVQKWRPVRGFVHARFVDAGGGNQYIVMEVEEGRVVQIVPASDHVELRVVPGSAVAAPESRAIPAIADLLAGVAPAALGAPFEAPRIELHPLLGAARTTGPRVPIVRLEVDEPEFNLPAGWGIFAAVERPTWDDVKRWQKALATVEDPDLRMIALYRLGDAHRSLGLPREARYYFAQGTRVGVPPAAMLLRRAEAALMIGDIDDARYACEQAWYRDARAGQVLACLGLLSLQSGNPAHGPTGRALARVAERASEHLVAGELLLRGGRYEEAVPPLEEAARHLHGSQLEVAQIALGDAWLLQGDVDRAQRAYIDAPHVSLDGLLRARELMVRMVRDGVRNWPAWMPDVDALVREGGPQGAEALFLAAQVHEQYQDDEAAAASYAALWDLYPVLRASDVPVRLLDACSRRIALLARDERAAEVIAAYEDCWRDELSEHVADPRMFSATSRSYQWLGLPDDALRVQLALTSVLASVGREDPAEIARLAELAVEADRPEQAIDTLRYARTLAATATERAQLDLIEGKALFALDRPAEARAALERAAADPSATAAARRYLAIVDLRSATACTDGLQALADPLAEGPLPETPPGEIELLALRCAASRVASESSPAVRAEWATRAVRFAEWAVERSRDAWTPEEARWLATVAAHAGGVALPDGLRSDAPALERVRAEDETHAAFLAEIAAWRNGRAR